MTNIEKNIYYFGPDKAEGNHRMKNLLGGKGANLAEMSRIGIPVPPGITLTTEVCNRYNQEGKEKLIEYLKPEMEAGIAYLEEVMGAEFGNSKNPLLVSVRSGARASMPGMMDTVLNLGLNDDSIRGLIERSGKIWFAWDSYRRFIQMYADVVMKVNKASENGRDVLDEIMEKLKVERKAATDQDLSIEDLQHLVDRYKQKILKITGREFPMDPWDQLWSAVTAVFESWFTPRASLYRDLNHIPESWGTAVNIQAMVFGNMGADSGSGVAFTRDPSTGENIFTGEYLLDAQGEDVVAGIRTPRAITLEGSRRWASALALSEDERRVQNLSLEEAMPDVFNELDHYRHKLEVHYKEMQDLEFTIQEGRLWILQTRTGKRTGKAMVRIGMEMLRDYMIDQETMLKRMDVDKLDELLHPVFNPEHLSKSKPLTKGLPASPGAATGCVVFDSDVAVAEKEKGNKTILVRMETIADDLKGMNAAQGVLTARGGMTSHAAVVARGMGKCCVSGAGDVIIDYQDKVMKVNGTTIHAGDWISLNGSTGEVFTGEIDTIEAELEEDFQQLLDIADQYAMMKVKTNADTPEAAVLARKLGARGIGLCRTEHMFFEGDRINAMREMIMADTREERRVALDKLLPMQRTDFEAIFKAMHGLPVTIRLIDPPLHEFVPHELEQQEEMAQILGLPLESIQAKVEKLEEANPMMGHRGCRLGISHPEIIEMQVRAILEAALSAQKSGIETLPEIMVPLIGSLEEFRLQKKVILEEAERIFKEQGETIDYKIGTMIEIPRATLVAGMIAREADFFSFGTNDLTQMTFGFSRDDVSKFLPDYIKLGVLKQDPFQVIDKRGVGQLMGNCVLKGRKGHPGMLIGVCGEHGGNAPSIEFFEQLGLNYVSCSPFRVPIARLAAAQASLAHAALVPEDHL